MLRLILFYLPMGASALLASLTHVIISGVLARSPHPDLTISGYALALSLSFILEQAIAPLRQTSAKYVKDQHSFREMVRMIVTIVGIIALFNALIAWTPLGRLLFHYVFGAQDSLLDATVNAYQILMFVNVFSAARSLYQGIIIQHLLTKWMTIGILIRLFVMGLMSWAMVSWNLTNDSRYGALLFLAGMAIESAVACFEGHSLARRLPDKLPSHPIVLIIRSAVYPWIDYLNGLAMYHGVNKTIAYSKFGNVILSVTILFLLVDYNPGLNGLIAGITSSVVIMFELSLSVYLFRKAVQRKTPTIEAAL
ncbi:hypothetical protein QFZ77_004880 [Paenibacillus sp. V4I3]|uniref:hypothetical protein n=1 Tax=Paenibacillus sp. V4I3 TaxID=3042305 RepID=UPI0027877980|nr:hypothetical protein [Paenibacillus sp. V4I3]MDQ0876221.1 hypothetical protein [Paenibacillus sp. V4I3]